MECRDSPAIRIHVDLIHFISVLKEKNCKDLPKDTEKAFEKVKKPIRKKTYSTKMKKEMYGEK